MKLLFQSSQTGPFAVGVFGITGGVISGTRGDSFSILIGFTLVVLICALLVFSIAVGLYIAFVPRKIAFHENSESYADAFIELREGDYKAAMHRWDSANFDLYAKKKDPRSNVFAPVRRHFARRTVRIWIWRMVVGAACLLGLSAVLIVLSLIVG